MNEDKEINELATEIYSLFSSRTMSRALASLLYRKGWRKQKEGEWKFEHEFYGKMLCSNCKKEALANENSEYVDSDFCPNCGAKMKGGAE